MIVYVVKIKTKVSNNPCDLVTKGMARTTYTKHLCSARYVNSSFVVWERMLHTIYGTMITFGVKITTKGPIQA